MPEDDEEDLLENQMNEDAEHDDFASFDASRYLNDRARRRGVLDERPEDISMGRRSRRTNLEDDDLAAVGSRSRRASARYESRRGSRLGSYTEDNERGALWTLFLSMVAQPGTRAILLTGVLLLITATVGCCALVFFLLRRG